MGLKYEILLIEKKRFLRFFHFISSIFSKIIIKLILNIFMHEHMFYVQNNIIRPVMTFITDSADPKFNFLVVLKITENLSILWKNDIFSDFWSEIYIKSRSYTIFQFCTLHNVYIDIYNRTMVTKSSETDKIHYVQFLLVGTP